MNPVIRESACRADVCTLRPLSPTEGKCRERRLSEALHPAIRIKCVALCVYVGAALTAAGIAHGDEPQDANIGSGLNDSGQTDVPGPDNGFVDVAAGVLNSLTTQRVFGDADGDGDVDLLDFSVFFDYLLGPLGNQQLAGWQSYDSDTDNDVDLGDFARWQNVFTGDAPVLGACCDHDPFGDCTDGLPLAACDCPTCEWEKLGSCSDLDCPHTAIPTVGEWGLVVLTLLLLTGAKLAFRRSNPPDPLKL